LVANAADRVLPVLLQLAEQMLPLVADAVSELSAAFEPLIPVLVETGKQIADKFVDALPDLADAFMALVNAVVTIDVSIVEKLVAAFVELVPYLPDLVAAGIELAVALADMMVAMVPLMPLFGELLTVVLRLATPGMLALIVTAVEALAFVFGLMADVLPDVLPWLAPVVGLLDTDWGKIGSAISGAFKTAWEKISGFVGDVLDQAKEIPGKVREAIGNVASTLYSKGKDLLSGLRNGIVDRYEAVKSWLGGLAGRVKSAVGSLTNTLYSKGKDLLSGLRNGITDRFRSARDWLKGLAQRAKSAVGDLSRTLWSA